MATLSPLRGLLGLWYGPTTYAVGCILSPLRGCGGSQKWGVDGISENLVKGVKGMVSG